MVSSPNRGGPQASLLTPSFCSQAGSSYTLSGWLEKRGGQDASKVRKRPACVAVA